MSQLSSQQMLQYEEEGFILVSGLIPWEIALKGEAAMWRQLGAQPDDPETWKGLPSSGGYRDPDLDACFTPEVCAAAAALAGEGQAALPPPNGIFAINIFPQGIPWQPHGPHIDHAIKAHGHRTFPRPLRVASLTYLNDVPPHGAGTVVWPGSHRKIEALAQSDPARFEMMWVLNEAIGSLDIGEPLEILGKQGDVLFYHYLCAHSGSVNASQRPRFALTHKW